MYICVYIYVYIDMIAISVYMYMYMYMYVYVCVYIYIYMFTCTDPEEATADPSAWITYPPRSQAPKSLGAPLFCSCTLLNNDNSVIIM